VLLIVRLFSLGQSRSVHEKKAELKNNNTNKTKQD